MAAPELQPGHDLGPYRVVRCLGTLGTHLALKLFTLEGDDADFLRQRFLTEGRILARLRHPRLVRVYDLAVDEGTGCPYFTMDLVLGPNGQPTTLENVRRARRVNEPEVARWYADVLEGLRAVHAAGIVHRDVKLENVLLDAEGHVVLSDFGVSRILSKGLGKEIEAVATESIKTPEDAQVLGTKGYLAPEVRKGEKATAAADYYALGFMLFRLLTGVWYEPGTDVFDLLAPFDPRWREVLGALLEPDPAKRCALPMDVKGMPAMGLPRKRLSQRRFRKVRVIREGSQRVRQFPRRATAPQRRFWHRLRKIMSLRSSLVRTNLLNSCRVLPGRSRWG